MLGEWVERAGSEMREGRDDPPGLLDGAWKFLFYLQQEVTEGF